MKRLYLIGGTMGVGKTSVCQILNRELPNSVFLDGDWCWNAHPFVVTDETKAMVTDNIVHMLNNFINCSAYKNIVFCWVMHRQSIIDELLKQIDTDRCEVITISLVCDEETLKARLAEDVKNCKRDADILGRSVERLPLYAALNTLKIDTTGKSAEEVADEIMRHGQF